MEIDIENIKKKEDYFPFTVGHGDDNDDKELIIQDITDRTKFAKTILNPDQVLLLAYVLLTPKGFRNLSRKTAPSEAQMKDLKK